MVPASGEVAHKRGPWTRPLELCQKHLIYAASVSAAINVLYLAPTLFMLQVYDRVVPSQGMTTLVFLSLLLLASLATLTALDVIRSQILIKATIRLERCLAEPLLENLVSTQGDAKGVQLLRDFDSFRQAATGVGALALFDAPWILVYVALCLMLHPLLGLVPLVGAVALGYLTLVTQRTTQKPIERANHAAAAAYSSQTQSAAAAGVITALGMGPALVRRHQAQRSTVVRLQSEASFKAASLLGLTRFLRLAMQSSALGLAAYLVLRQQLTPGAIFAASLLTSRALGPLEQLLNSWRTLEEALNAYRTLRAAALSRSTAARTNLPLPSGEISIQQVTVLGAPGRPPILHGVGLHLSAGKVLGIVGPSGSGKTTLLSVIVGARRADQGTIRFDGAAIGDWAPERLGRHVGYVPQDLGLLTGTVKQNICRFRDHLEEDLQDLDRKAVSAARACGIHELILLLPQGYDTIIGTGGQGISLGQAQRVAVARALFDEPRILVMDEPNAHLDAEGEAALIRLIAELKRRGVTVIVVAHRTSLLEIMDELLVLKDGRVLQQGPRDEVLAQMNRHPTRPTPVPIERRFA